MSTKHFRTTAPTPIELIDDVAADSRRFRSIEEVEQHLQRPLIAAELASPSYEEQPPSGLRQRLELGHAPRGLKERLLGEEPADNASGGLRKKLGLEPAAKTFRERIAQRK